LAGAGGINLAASATNIWQKHKIFVIGGAALLVAGIVVLILALTVFGGNVVGTWELVETREYERGRVTWMQRADPGELRIELIRGGTLLVTTEDWRGNRQTNTGEWERVSRGRAMFSGAGLGGGNVIDYRVRGRELRLTMSSGSDWEEVAVFRRAR
jgi:hypothetical protein